jgi:outer membrane receptor protein involved in Fe transport
MIGMKNFGLLGSSALGSAALIGFSFAFATPAAAQSQTAAPASAPPLPNCAPGTTPNVTGPACPEALHQNETELQSGQPAESPATGEQIVVTGTRINRPNLTSSVPITTLGIQELTSGGNVSLGDQLNQLPQLRQTFSQANSTRFIGTSGINALDLRGIGNARTLVLANGRRQVTATPGIERVDVNTIPTDLVERVDIVTGGNSAVYGSDAVAGVVNFVLKRNFSGIRVRAQGGISSRGDRGSYFVSVTAGQNFAGGRGNIAVAAEYAKQDTLYFTQRDEQTGAYSGRTQYNLYENTGPNLNPSAGPLHGSEPSTGNGIPDRVLLTGVRNNSISEGGLFTASCPTAAATGESAAAFAARRAAACSGIANPGSANPLAQFGRTYVFDNAGNLIPNPCIEDLRGPSGGNSTNCRGGLGSTLRLTGMLQPGLERKAVNLLAHFDVTDAFQPFIEAKFVRIDANQEGQPTFFTNTFRLDNPFLSPQARASLTAALAPGATTFTAQRFNIDFGGRGELHKRETYSIVGGVSGTFNGDWKYEASVNYGHLWTYYETQGNLLRARYANAIDAARNAQGQIVCRINLTTVVDPACVPVNLFGEGQVSQAALNYFGYTSSRVQRASLLDAQAYVSGDLSQLFELPGGPIAFVIGSEIRRETSFAAYDPTTSSTACGVSGCTFLNIIPDFRPPALVVKEVFGEVRIPLLKDMPFFKELSIDGAGRYSHYNIGQTGGVFAWNVNGTWAPVSDLRFRAGYARAIRAPTQSDLYAPQSQTFLNTFTDPCGQQNINNNPNRVKNCAAAGVPTTQTFNGTTEPFTNRIASGIVGVNAGNPLLREERSSSLTVGGVFQPRWIPGFSLTVDYYHIKLKNAINAIGPQAIINQCYDNPSGINNPYCAVIFRNANGTFAGQGNVIHGGGTVNLTPTGNSFVNGPFNYASLDVSGIDFDLAYRHRISNDVRLNLRAILTHTFKKNNYTDITNPAFYDRQLSELGDPAWQGQFSANVEYGIFNFGYRMRWLGRQIVGPVDYETFFSVQGRPPLDPDAYPVAWYANTFYHDFRLDIAPNNRFKFYLGVDNAFDKLPPRDLVGNEGGNPYDPVGRFFYAGVEVKF